MPLCYDQSNGFLRSRVVRMQLPQLARLAAWRLLQPPTRRPTIDASSFREPLQAAFVRLHYIDAVDWVGCVAVSTSVCLCRWICSHWRQHKNCWVAIAITRRASIYCHVIKIKKLSSLVRHRGIPFQFRCRRNGNRCRFFRAVVLIIFKCQQWNQNVQPFILIHCHISYYFASILQILPRQFPANLNCVSSSEGDVETCACKDACVTLTVNFREPLHAFRFHKCWDALGRIHSYVFTEWRKKSEYVFPSGRDMSILVVFYQAPLNWR